MTKKQVFTAMFRALDCLYDENPSEELKEYLSGANPDLFIDRESADPAVYAEFVEFEKLKDGLSYEEAFFVVKEYLKTKKDFVKRLEEISLSEWQNLCRIVESERKS